MRVVVVGAGLAGMRAAVRLRAAGADVIVLEAGTRVGGRARTVAAAFAGGQYAETGAEWVDTYHHRMAELMERYGVRRLGAGEQWTSIRRWVHLEGRLLSPDDLRREWPSTFEELDEFDRRLEHAAAGIADPARPTAHPDAAALDRSSLADLAAEVGLGRVAALIRRRDAQGEFAAEPGDVSLLFVAQQRAHQFSEGAGTVVRAHRVEGGVSRIAEGLASELGDVIERGVDVTAVEQDERGARVLSANGAYDADHVIVACSLPAARRIRLDPQPPPALAAAIGGLGYGAITKTAVQWAGREWPPGYATTDARVQRVYEPTIDQPGIEGILMSYCGGDGGLEWAQLSDAERVGLAAQGMRELHGLDAQQIGGTSRAWSSEPRFGGAYAVYRPGEVLAYWDVLRAPWGRVHLAGEHVATCTGYMEGALESGDTVADRLLASGTGR
ncbi:MAG: flavin monoamine oxidase family protein [Ilumatobacteraceae bacterium]